jgi:hypothetical protein
VALTLSSLVGVSWLIVSTRSRSKWHITMMNLHLILAILFALLLLRRFYYSYIVPTFIERPVGGVPRPPLVADWIPFIGNGLKMTQGDGFWRDVVRQYGPVVRVRAMGEVRTFVTTPAVSPCMLPSQGGRWLIVIAHQLCLQELQKLLLPTL